MIPSRPKNSLIKMAGLLKKECYTPIVDKIVRPSDIQETFTYVSAGKKTGNVILDLREFH